MFYLQVLSTKTPRRMLYTSAVIAGAFKHNSIRRVCGVLGVYNKTGGKLRTLLGRNANSAIQAGFLSNTSARKVSPCLKSLSFDGRAFDLTSIICHDQYIMLTQVDRPTGGTCMRLPNRIWRAKRPTSKSPVYRAATVVCVLSTRWVCYPKPVLSSQA